MKKNFLTGLTVSLLSLILVLAGCEGPTGADGAAGGGGPGLPGPITQDLSAAQLQTILDAGWNPVYVVGDVGVTGTGTVTIPAGQTLSVLGGKLNLNSGVLLNAVAGPLDLSQADATGLSGTSDTAVVILPANYAYSAKLASTNLTKALVAATKEAAIAALDTGSAAIYGTDLRVIGTSDISAFGSTNTLYVLGSGASIDATSAFDTGSAKIVVLDSLAAKGAGGLTVGSATVINKLVASDALTVTNVSGTVETLDLGGFAVTVTPSPTGLFTDITNSGAAATLTVNATSVVDSITVGATDITLAGGATSLTVTEFTAKGTGKLGLPAAVAILSLGGEGTVKGTVAHSGVLTLKDGSYITIDDGASITQSASALLTLKAGNYFAAGDVTISASGVLGAVTGAGNGLMVGADEENYVALGSGGGAASTITPTNAATELSASGILVKGTAVLTVDDAGTAGATIEAVGNSTITVQSADGTTAKVVLKDVTLLANVNSGDDVILTGGDTANVAVNFSTAEAVLTLADGGSIAVTGAGVVKVGTNTELKGGTFTFTGKTGNDSELEITLNADAKVVEFTASDKEDVLSLSAAALIDVADEGSGEVVTGVLDLSATTGGGGVSITDGATFTAPADADTNGSIKIDASGTTNRVDQNVSGGGGTNAAQGGLQLDDGEFTVKTSGTAVIDKDLVVASTKSIS